MNDWTFVIVPLLVLPIVVLFRFVGCAKFRTEDAPPKPPRYRDYIMGEPGNPGTVIHVNVEPNPQNIIGYWRLTDPDGTQVAKDETGKHPGTYHGTPTEVVSGLSGLIVSDPAAKGRLFDSGYVLVPAKSSLSQELAPEEFTIEAWVFPKWAAFDKDKHFLFMAGGNYHVPFFPPGQPRYAGFLMYTEGRTINASFGPTGFAAFQTKVDLPLASTHLALIVAKNPGDPFRRDLRLLLNGIVAATATLEAYTIATGAPLIIGAASTASDPTLQPIVPTKPFKGQIQEVVLHKVALTDNEIENHVNINK